MTAESRGWNSGRLWSMNATVSPRRTPSAWNPAASRLTLSAYSANVIVVPSRIVRRATCSARAAAVSWNASHIVVAFSATGSPVAAAVSSPASITCLRTLQADCSACHEPVARDDLVDHRGGDRRVGRNRHRRKAVVAVGEILWLAADGRRHDVDAVSAEDGADTADHPRHVAIAEQRDVVLELHVESLAPRRQQVRAVAAADQRADGPDRL